MSLFSTDDYRDALRDKAAERRALLPGFTYQTLAAACRVQKAYLSRVFKKDAELSQDQVFLACQTLGLDGIERDYVFALHSYTRSTLTARRHELKREIDRLRDQAQETRRHLAVGTVDANDPERFGGYFLDPDMQLAHVLLTVDRFAKEPRAIGPVLGLSSGRIDEILESLHRLGAIETDRSGKVRVAIDALHLPTTSAAYRPYRTLVRQKALSRIQSLGKDEGYFFSVVFSANGRAERRIRDGFLALLKEVESDVRRAPADDVYQMSFDLFPWTTKSGKSAKG